MSRKTAREYAFKGIFAYLFTDVADMKYMDRYLSTDSDTMADDTVYLNDAYMGVIAHADELRRTAEGFLTDFSLDRVAKADLAAIMLATYEMMYMTDIPRSVSINEAVELVKRYSTEKSAQFVNGVLASVFKTLEPR